MNNQHLSLHQTPCYLKEQFRNQEISSEQLREVEDRAIRDIVKFQEDLGLEGITDGEYRRTYFHTDFLTQLGGVVTEGGKRQLQDR